ncbi:MAG: hypothetical protein NVSMB2_18670 [Chloroflexota bacterium]
MRRSFVTAFFTVLVAVRVAPVSAAPLEASAYTVRVLDLTNAERQKAGLAPLALNHQLVDAAQSYSQVLAASDCFDHTCGPVPDFTDRAAQAGYTAWNSLGENIAAGYATPDDVVSGWMKSPAHRANILSSKFTEMGVGLVTGGGAYGTYWAQEFGARANTTMNFAPLPLGDAPQPDDTGDATDAS